MRVLILLLAVSLSLAGCVVGYTLVPATPVSVAKGSMKVQPSNAWNRIPKNTFHIAQEENWTQNGPLLDSITFVGALREGAAIAKQRPKDDRKVPAFRADMSPQDLVSMIESYYRIKAGATIFEATSVKPADFLGKPGVQFDYRYIGSDEVKRRGRSMVAIIDGKLYLIQLDAAAVHYFDAALPEFEALVASASIS